MNVLQFPLKGSDQYVEYLLQQRFKCVQHISMIDDVLREWGIALVHTPQGIEWHRVKPERKPE